MAAEEAAEAMLMKKLEVSLARAARAAASNEGMPGGGDDGGADGGECTREAT